MGELVEDPPGALWRRADLEAARARAAGPLDEILVAVDPPAGEGPRADACGIVAAGAYDGANGARCALVLGDFSVRGLSPSAWSARAAEAAATVGAHAIVAEANNGGELVRTLLRLAAPDIPVRLVHARDSKRVRAGPVAMQYEMGRVAHAARFPALEDEMCAFGAPGFSGSPDRVDALVWALTLLLINRAAPRMRAV